MTEPITDAEIARLEATPLEYAPICAMLISRLRAAEREREGLRCAINLSLGTEASALIARAEKAERERDEALSRLATVRDEWHVERAARRAAKALLGEAAEMLGRVDNLLRRLHEALRDEDEQKVEKEGT